MVSPPFNTAFSGMVPSFLSQVYVSAPNALQFNLAVSFPLVTCMLKFTGSTTNRGLSSVPWTQYIILPHKVANTV